MLYTCGEIAKKLKIGLPRCTGVISQMGLQFKELGWKGGQPQSLYSDFQVELVKKKLKKIDEQIKKRGAKVKTFFTIGIILLLFGINGCSKNPVLTQVGPERERVSSFSWSGKSGVDWLYASEIKFMGISETGNEIYASVEKTYQLKEAYDFKSNLQINFTDEQYNKKTDYSSLPPQVWISKKNGTIRIIGSNEKYFELSFYYYK